MGNSRNGGCGTETEAGVVRSILQQHRAYVLVFWRRHPAQNQYDGRMEAVEALSRRLNDRGEE
jgi:hypothetical protein